MKSSLWVPGIVLLLLGVLLCGCEDPVLAAQSILVMMDIDDVSEPGWEHAFPFTLIDGNGALSSEPCSFNVLNPGQQDLALLSVEVSSGDAADFDIDATNMLSVIPSRSLTRFTVQFSPTELGLRFAQITVTSDDPTQPSITFGVTGYGFRDLVTSDAAPSYNRTIAISGDTAVVGEPSSDAAYIFYRDEGGSDQWGEVTKVTGDSDFGHTVALDGDTLVVGTGNLGKVYIFYRDQDGADNWGLVQTLTNMTGLPPSFGWSLAVSGETLVIGEPWERLGVEYAGAAYVHERDVGGPDNWGEVKKLELADGDVQDYFGRSVAVSGDTVVVGRPSPVPADGGSVFVFGRNHDGIDNWGLMKQLTPGDGLNTGNYGESMVLSGDTAFIGRPNHSGGAVYVLSRGNGGPDQWGVDTVLTSGAGGDSQTFGEYLSLSGSNLLVSGTEVRELRSYDTEWEPMLYVLVRNEGGTDAWGEVWRIPRESSLPAGLSGDTVIWALPHAEPYEGSARVWHP